ncbi:MAG: hypothetical protein ACOYKD_08380 [Anaerolineaceae bacterium]
MPETIDGGWVLDESQDPLAGLSHDESITVVMNAFGCSRVQAERYVEAYTAELQKDMNWYLKNNCLPGEI